MNPVPLPIPIPFIYREDFHWIFQGIFLGAIVWGVIV